MKTPLSARLALPAALAAAALAIPAGRAPAAPGEGDAKASPVAPRMEPDPACLKAGGTRTFQIAYTAHVKDIPGGTKVLRVWLPVPQDSALQLIADLKFEGALQPTLHTESRFGNRLAYFEVKDPGAKFDATMSFTCTRKEVALDLARLKEDGKETDPRAAEFLKSDRLTIVDDRIQKMADEITKGKTATLDKARAIYDYVFDHMKYDKSGQGWGRGDTNHACEVGKGNCTDFHALFMSLCRASGIAAGFEIGLYPPYDRGVKEPKLGGYHCWAFFRVPGKSWVPVDISEASNNRDRKEFFFGGHTSNRVTLSVGRDLVLEPKQAGEPLNFLLNPYAEADGKVLATTSKDWTLKDVP